MAARRPLVLVWFELFIFALGVEAVCFANGRGDGDLTKLSEGVYALIASPDGNTVSNSGVVLLEQSVLVFDTHFTPEAGLALLTKIQAITSKPVRFVVNSHFHPDHTHGNQAFVKTQQIIATGNARRDILQKDQPGMQRMLTAAQSQIDRLVKDLPKTRTTAEKEAVQKQIAARQDFLERMKRVRIVAPTITVDDRMYIQDGTREVRLFSPGPGHTDGDLVMFLPAEKVVFLGDLFFNASLPNVQDASLLEWIRTLGEVLRLDAEQFVPGHGPVGSKKDVANFLGYLEDLKALVEPAVARGDTVDQVVRDTRIPAKYASYGFANFFQANLQKMYAELKALQMVSPTVSAPEEPKKSETEKPLP